MTLLANDALINTRGFDSDYQAILSRATTLGYALPSPTKQQQENAFMMELKAAFGLTTNDSITLAPIIQGLMFKTDGDSDYATLSWAGNPSVKQATKVNSPSFTANLGFNGNASSSYLLAGYFSDDVDDTDVTFASRGFVDNAVGSRSLFGYSQGFITQSSVFLNPRNASNQMSYNLYDGVNTVFNSVFDATFRWIIGRKNGIKYRSANGANFVATTSAGTAFTINREMTLLAMNGSTVQFFANSGNSYHWCFSRLLTNAESAAFDAAIVNYLA